MKSKVLLSILLSLTIVFLAACGGEKNTGGETPGGQETDGPSTENVTIRYAYWNDKQTPYLEASIEEFNKEYPNIKIVLEPTIWDEYWTKLEAAATGGSIADVFWMNGPNIAKYVNGGIVMPLDERIEAAGIDLNNYPKGLVDLYNVDGNQYAVPKDFDTIGVWYNKKIFDEAGVEYPTDDWTWDDMVEKAKALTKDDGSVYGITAGYTDQEGFYSTVFAAGGYIISDDKKSSGYNLPETRAGIQCWVDLLEKGYSPSQASLDDTNSVAQFFSGRTAMYWGGSWRLNNAMATENPQDFDVVELPSINGNKATVIHGLGNCIFKNTKHPEEAWAWANFLAGKKSNEISAELGAAIPALKGTADLWVEKHPEYNLKSFITSSQEYSYPYPASINTAEWAQYQGDNLKKAFSLEISVDEACDRLAEQMDQVLANE